LPTARFLKSCPGGNSSNRCSTAHHRAHQFGYASKSPESLEFRMWTTAFMALKLCKWLEAAAHVFGPNRECFNRPTCWHNKVVLASAAEFRPVQLRTSIMLRRWLSLNIPRRWRTTHSRPHGTDHAQSSPPADTEVDVADFRGRSESLAPANDRAHLRLFRISRLELISSCRLANALIVPGCSRSLRGARNDKYYTQLPGGIS